MINPTDIRAGNWVLKVMGADRENEPFIEYNAITLEEHFYAFASGCFPIPLSSCILEQCGFKQQLGYWYKALQAESIDEAAPVLRYNNDNKNWYVNDVRIPARPLYVHQLQNLYYALTGQELVANLGFYQNLPLFGPITFFNPIRKVGKDQELL